VPSVLPIPLLLFTVTALILVDERRPVGGSRNLRWVAVWKPLSSGLVILVAALSFAGPGPADATYSLLILLGLLWSFAGDVLLILPARESFIFGLIAFLFAHVVYAAAFARAQVALGAGSNMAAEVIAAAALAIIATAMYRYLQPSLGKLRVPVILYILVISIMLHRALAVAFALPATSTLLMAAGALLFYVSDAILAIDRFKMHGRMPRGHLWNLSTYYLGQLLIALSASYVLSQ
jgi:uncharacterized membrane protein YhhN